MLGLGTTNVTFSVQDSSSNATSCFCTITVADLTPPVLVCAPNKQVECGAAWSFDEPAATDNCGVATVTVVSTITNTLCGSTFAAIRTWEAVDAAATRRRAARPSRSLDTTPPSLICPGGKVLEFQDETGA